MKKFFTTLIALLFVGNMFAQKNWTPQVRDQVKNAIKTILLKGDISAYKTRDALTQDYDQVVERVTELLVTFARKADTLVFASDLERYMQKAVEKKLTDNGIRPDDIPASLVTELNDKGESIIRNLNRLLRYHDGSYVTKAEVKEAIDWEIDSYFINKIKENSNSSGFFESISDAWSNFINAITGNNDAPPPTNPELEELPVPVAPSAPELEEPGASNIQIFFDGSCSICINDFYGEERVGVLNCGHCFHPECIKPWLEQSKTCPLCRKENVYLAKIYDSKEQVPR